MRASFRSFSSRLFVIIGTVALLALIVSAAVGEFSAQVGPLRLSVRDPLRPLLIALGAWLVAAWNGRAEMREALTAAFRSRRSRGWTGRRGPTSAPRRASAS